MKQFYTRMLTRTALLLALCVVVQQFKTVSQFITGPLVNLILLLAALAVGLGSGLCIAVLSPILAFLIAPSKKPSQKNLSCLRSAQAHTTRAALPAATSTMS